MDSEVLGTEPEGLTPDAPELVAEPAAQVPVTPEPEQFIDPRDLPPEIVPHFKRMQAAFTKKMQAVARDRDKVELVNKYRSDPDFARQFIQQELQRFGVGAQTAQPQAPQGGGGRPPQPFVDAITQKLPQELQWMAPAIAEATYASVAHLTAPMLQQNQNRVREERESEWDGLAQDLSQRQPGWEAHEDDMLEIYDFLQSPKLKHPVYGSKLDLLLNLVTGNAAATQRAIQRMSDAGRSRTTTGQPSRTTIPNISDRVRKAPDTRSAWKIAADSAIQQLAGGGGA